MNVHLASFGIIDSELCFSGLEQTKTLPYLFWIVDLLTVFGVILENGFP